MGRIGTAMVCELLLLVGWALPLAARPGVSEGEAPKPERAETTAVGIAFSFKLDPRLTRAQYLGDRWVALPTYSINQAGTTATVDARAHCVDTTGKKVPARPRWRPADPVMVTVTPDEGSDVTITVHRPGESRLRVSADGVSRDLTVKAVRKKGAILVQIAQVPPEGTPEAEARARILGGQAEKVGYALGLNVGRKLRQQRAEVDAASFARGLTDALGGTTLLTETELQGALVSVRSHRRALLPKDGAEGVERQSGLAGKNKSEGEAFLAENKMREGVVTLASGLQYRVLTAGDGPTPSLDDRVVCHYRGTLIDGTEFDSSFKGHKPRTFPLRGLIEGWREALPLMPVGSKWQLFVPPELAYGVRGTRGIPPNATLVFEVELLSIQEQPRARRQAEDSLPELATRERLTP